MTNVVSDPTTTILGALGAVMIAVAGYAPHPFDEILRAVGAALAGILGATHAGFGAQKQ